MVLYKYKQLGGGGGGGGHNASVFIARQHDMCRV
jgi:hypothetical protein